MLAGLLFRPEAESLRALKERTHDLNTDYNQTYQREPEKRRQILEDLLGEIGEDSFFQGPIYFHYGKHTFVGREVFANFHFTVQDDARVVIGDRCHFGPGVTIVTPLHPLLAEERHRMKGPDGKADFYCYALPVRIGNDCWFGANVTVCPGVSVGEGCVIGAGSVITRDIPPGVLAAGVPCRVIRPLTEADSMRYRPELLGDVQGME